MAKQRTLLELAVKAKAGDVGSLAEVLHRFRALIRSCSRGLPNADREDLEQELSMLLIHLIMRYDPCLEAEVRSAEEAPGDHGAAAQSERSHQTSFGFGPSDAADGPYHR